MLGIWTFSFVTKAVTAVLPAWFSLFPVLPAAFPTAASVHEDAWWSVYNAGLPVAVPTTVPADALGVGHNGAEPDKIAAIGITLQAPLGSAIQKLRLDLKEATEPGANIDAESAAVAACPITGPWEPVMNGNWADVPSYDCSLGKIAGKRSDDGTWAFDLAPVGAQWLDANFPLGQEGLVFLIETSSTPVQVSFRSVRTGDFRLEFSAASSQVDEPTEPVVVGELDVPETSSAPPNVTPSAPEAEPESAVLLTQPAQSRREKVGKPDLLGNMPWGVWLLIPIAIGGAAAVSYALGPGMRGARGRQRLGPVSRALSRRSEEL